MEGASAFGRGFFYWNDGELVSDNLAFGDHNLAFECDILSQALNNLALRSVLLAIVPHLLAFASFLGFSHGSLPSLYKTFPSRLKFSTPPLLFASLFASKMDSRL